MRSGKRKRTCCLWLAAFLLNDAVCDCYASNHTLLELDFDCFIGYPPEFSSHGSCRSDIGICYSTCQYLAGLYFCSDLLKLSESFLNLSLPPEQFLLF